MTTLSSGESGPDIAELAASVRADIGDQIVNVGAFSLYWSLQPSSEAVKCLSRRLSPGLTDRRVMLEGQIILGAGVTGLAAGASGSPVYEAESEPGGICSSYYCRAGDDGVRRHDPQGRDDLFRFEKGGGHWIFGGDSETLRLIESLAPCERFTRAAAVFFARTGLSVPYPLQKHVDALPPKIARAAMDEMQAGTAPTGPTMADWLEASFGPTLGALFFAPFHERYTAGLWRDIAPQDAYKSPGARNAPSSASAGYNTTFIYPRDGLDALVRALAARVVLKSGKRIVRIDPEARRLTFADGGECRFSRLISTLPLNRMVELCDLDLPEAADPHTSVLVLNIAARKGPRCPSSHWLYVPDSRSGFYRVGIYSNVSARFVPASYCDAFTCLYVERAWRGGVRPDVTEIASYTRAVVAELQDWGFIGEVAVLDPTWIDVAYTWARPGSRWTARAIDRLAERGIEQAGRFARWKFQGIAESLRDGFTAGGAAAVTRGR